MFNKYTIELKPEGTEVKASIFLGNDKLGTVWVPGNLLASKKDFENLFTAIGYSIYGQENKARKEAQSDSQLLEALQTKGKKKQEDISETEA